jgi:hypothetical protein
MATVFGLVNPQGLIENAFYWNEGQDYPTEEGYSIVRIDNVENCGIGWTYIDGVFTEPVQEDTAPVEQPISQGAQTL